MQKTGQKVYSFASFRLDPIDRRLWKDGSIVSLSPRVFDLLVFFIGRKSQLLEREFLLSELWADRSVDEANLSVCISTLRKALGDSASSAKFIETVPTKGYRFIAAVVEEQWTPEQVKPLNAELPILQTSIDTAPPVTSTKANTGPDWLFASALLVLTSAILFFTFHGGRPSSMASLAAADIRPLTHASGEFQQPAFSRDGDTVAYSWDSGVGGGARIVTQALAGETGKKLTVIAGDEFSPVWGPRDTEIAFLRCRRRGDAMQVVAVDAKDGRKERRISAIAPYVSASLGPGGPPSLDWSANGKLLVTSDFETPDVPRSIVLIASDTGSKKFITKPPAQAEDAFARFSPDGKTIAFRRKFAGSAEDVFLIPVGNGPERRLTFERKAICGLTWSVDAKSLIVCSSRGGGFGNLWRVPIDGGAAVHLTPAHFHADMPTISADGKRLAYVNELTDDNIWRYALDGSTRPQKIVASNFLDSGPHYSPDGESVAFRSKRTGNDEIWVARPDGTNARHVTSFKGPVTGSPQWSPNGTMIVFDSRASGSSDIYLVKIGGKPARLTPSAADEEVPSWSFDGRSIYFSSNRTGRYEIWQIPSSGGEAKQITHGGAFHGIQSPDGRYLYYVHDLKLTSIWRLDLVSGQEREVIPSLGPGMWAYWTLTRSSIYFLKRGQNSHAEIFRLNLANNRLAKLGTTESLPAFDDKGLSISPDQRSLLVTQRDTNLMQIMLAENLN